MKRANTDNLGGKKEVDMNDSITGMPDFSMLQQEISRDKRVTVNVPKKANTLN